MLPCNNAKSHLFILCCIIVIINIFLINLKRFLFDLVVFQSLTMFYAMLSIWANPLQTPSLTCSLIHNCFANFFIGFRLNFIMCCMNHSRDCRRHCRRSGFRLFMLNARNSKRNKTIKRLFITFSVRAGGNMNSHKSISFSFSSFYWLSIESLIVFQLFSIVQTPNPHILCKHTSGCAERHNNLRTKDGRRRKILE